MTAFTLRAYQEKSIRDLRAVFLQGVRRVVLQAPTGSGKTVLTAHMMRTAHRKGQTSWFVVHRKELLEQTSKALWQMDVPHGMIAAGRSLTSDAIQVASIQTLVRRLDHLQPPNMVIIDEAHHATANTYRKVVDFCNDSWIIGLTATPSRTDGTGLSDIFHALVRGPELATLIAEGYLAPFRIYSPPSPLDMTGVHIRAGDYAKDELAEIVDQSVITGNAVEHYRRCVAPRTCLIYCVSRLHARHVEEAYRSSGLDALYVAGDTPKAERDAAISGFRKGKPRIIVSVDLFGEGLDVPGLGAVQLLRPTQSLGLHLQQVGRVLRYEEGKEAVILDHVGNTWRHGFPDDIRSWTLEGQKRKKNDEAAINLRSCPECFAIYPAHLRACPLCGCEAVGVGRKNPEEVAGTLEEMDREKIREQKAKRIEQGTTRELEGLVALAIERGHKIPWAGIVYSKRKYATLSENQAIKEAWRIFRGMQSA